MAWRRALVLAFAALAAAAPGQAVPVTLYAHVIDSLQDFPFSTQAPDDAYRVDSGIGVATATVSCLPEVQSTGLRQEHHTVYGFSSPTRIDYETMESGRPRYGPERGLGTDVELDPEAPMALHWYLSSPRPDEPNGQAVPTPNVVVRATMRTNDAISVDDTSYNEGEVLASGQSEAALLAGPSSQGVEVEEVDGRSVYHFVVPMTMEQSVIPRATGFNLRVDVLMDGLPCSEGYLMTNSVFVHTSPDHRPRLEFEAERFVRIESVYPQVIDDQLVVLALLQDAWGPTDLVSASLDLRGPGLEVTLPGNLTRPDAHHHVHGQYFLGTQVAFVLPLDRPLANATYDLRITATTLQGAVEEAEVSVQLGEAREAPGPGAFLLAAGVALGLAARRRPLP